MWIETIQYDVRTCLKCQYQIKNGDSSQNEKDPCCNVSIAKASRKVSYINL